MSNSRKKTAVESSLFVDSEKADKRRFNKALRRKTKAITKSRLLLESAKDCDFEDLDVLPIANEVMAQADFSKCGKRFFTVSDFVVMFRDRIVKQIFIPPQLALISLDDTDGLEAEAKRWYNAALRK